MQALFLYLNPPPTLAEPSMNARGHGSNKL